MSSHSPTITAKTKLDNVIVMNNVGNNIVSTSIKDTLLSADDRKFLKKFLDVTKSQLFFSKGVILVEGITEALLMPIFARLIDENYDLDKNGIEVVVTGISFQRYAGLFNSDENTKRLNFKCAVITDDDRGRENLSDGRLKNLIDLSRNNFNTYIGENTFEWEIFNANLDSDIIPNVFDSVHPNIRNMLDKNSEEFNPLVLVEKLTKNRTKSEFAYNLAEYLENNPIEASSFVIPEYIKKAICFVVSGCDEEKIIS